MSTYSQEVLVLKKEILTEISNELKNIINTKIKTNTKAYYELKKTISQWESKINEISNRINHNDVNEKFSFIKIDRKTLESLINLNNKLKFGSISKLLVTLIINYEDLFVKYSLVEIKSFNLNKNTQLLLNNTVDSNVFEICNGFSSIYKLSDIRIEDVNNEEDSILLYARSTRTDAVCPYCGNKSHQVHSRYIIHSNGCTN
jgi:hypothetical protein